MSDYDYCGTDDPENIICNELDDGAAGATVMKAFDDLGFVVVRKDELSLLRAENEKLVEALKKILAIDDKYSGSDWEEIEEARLIARDAISENNRHDPQ